MTVLGGVAVSYERGAPAFNVQRAPALSLKAGLRGGVGVAAVLVSHTGLSHPLDMYQGALENRRTLVQGYLAHKKPRPPRNLQYM